MASSSENPPAASLTREGEVLTIAMSGPWSLTDRRTPAWHAPVEARGARRIVIEDRGLGRWDSSAALYVMEAGLWCERKGCEFDLRSIPDELRQLALQAHMAAHARRSRRPERKPALARVGAYARDSVVAARAAATFVGDCALGLLRAARLPRTLRIQDLLLHIQQAGPEGLPIIGLVAFLVGTIIAFQSALQLQRFGAEILVVDLVDLSVTREMGAMMVAVVLSGRTAAAYAAELGSMAAGEQIDALETAGVSPVDFLVVPRLLALVFVTPLLTLYADMLAVLGGSAVALGMFKIPPIAFYYASKEALQWRDIRMGLTKSVVFGLIVGVCGCLRGVNAQRDTAGVGRAATSAVVTSILWIVVADALFGRFFALVTR